MNEGRIKVTHDEFLYLYLPRTETKGYRREYNQSNRNAKVAAAKDTNVPMDDPLIMYRSIFPFLASLLGENPKVILKIIAEWSHSLLSHTAVHYLAPSLS
jgi:hypothetical protein